MKTITYLIIVCTGLLVGCAHMPPKELINARQAYQDANAGQAGQLVPAELHKALVALNIAEKSFQDDPTSFRTRDLAYIADRKAKMAEALATTAAGNAATAKANKDYQATQSEIVKNTKENLAASERSSALKTEQIASEQKAGFDAETRLIKQQVDANAEARLEKESTDAEARRVKGLADAEVRRLNTIITLEKGKKVVLKGINFETNKATLRMESQTNLMQAYNALVANPTVQVEISGHTDNVGSQHSNQVLSLKRAQAVRNWLVQKGIASNRMNALGKGDNEPLSSNDTDAGRAENRRIEFYVEK
jgi:outer membrane protein OmpA-like peptidoglycan-associated protein